MRADWIRLGAWVLAAVLALPASVPALDFSRPEASEHLPGGAATGPWMPNRNAFTQPAANLPADRRADFEAGDAIFERLWQADSEKKNPGLGPLFNSRSCQRCHLKNGRGDQPVAKSRYDTAVSMLMRLSIPARNAAERDALRGRRVSVIPAPVYGGQLQDFAAAGVAPEGRIEIAYSERPVALAGGEPVSLRAPTYTLSGLGYGPPHPELMMSPRIALPLIGMGLLAAIAEADILAAADPGDRDGDGISGRPNRVWSEAKGRAVLGRFGWKAGQPSLRQQSAAAFANDIGISTPIFADGFGDCTQRQTTCRQVSRRALPEAPARSLDLVTFYAANLAVPARREAGDPEVLAGKKLFHDSGCAACHRPTFVTGTDPANPSQSKQRIWPYTDLLLHDMGPGLADGRPEAAASGREWRTAPLWGIGLAKMVNVHTRFLHDGRARDLLEAILWHGGEAEASRRKVVEMPPSARARLLRFLNSL